MTFWYNNLNVICYFLFYPSYQIITNIGTGSFADVYLAVKRNDDSNSIEGRELVAVKQIRSIKRSCLLAETDAK